MTIKLIVGNASSSGSTLLSDIIDSTQHSACGQELEIFSNRRFFEGERNFRVSASTPSLYTTRTKVRINRLHGYGVNERELTYRLNTTDSFSSFVEWFAAYYLSLRGKKKPWLFVEKTPVNVHNIQHILNLDSDTYFLFMTRDPIYACTSMRKRGRSWYSSCGTWLTTAASYYSFKDHQRMISLRYEDFIKEPFLTVTNLLKKLIGVNLNANDLEHSYKNNLYRQFRSIKIHSWGVNQFGVIRDANTRKISSEDIQSFNGFLRCALNKKFAEHFDMAPVDFKKMLDHFHYSDNRYYLLNKTSKFQKSAADTKLLLSKFINDFMNRDATLALLSAYLNPIIYF